MQLNSRTAVITGGASGMGRALALRLHRQGVNVCILDTDRAEGAGLAASLGDRAAFHAADVTDDGQVAAAIDAAADRFGDIHICCNFAGAAILGRTVGSRGPLPMATFRRCIEVNLCGTFNVVRLCADRMTRNAELDDGGGRGCIVTVSSVAAFQGPSGTAAYSAAKAAIVGMTLPLARDLAPFGIRVNTIAPGLILTPMTWGRDASRRDEAERRAAESLRHVLHPARFGSAEEVAHLTQSLIENDYINAECIRIDGGKRV